MIIEDKSFFSDISPEQGRLIGILAEVSLKAGMSEEDTNAFLDLTKYVDKDRALYGYSGEPMKEGTYLCKGVDSEGQGFYGIHRWGKSLKDTENPDLGWWSYEFDFEEWEQYEYPADFEIVVWWKLT